MKSLHFFLVAAIGLTLLSSCRDAERTGMHNISETTAEAVTSSFDEPGDPPKDKPRDRDNWKPALNHRR